MVFSHCSLRDEYGGEADVIARLGGGQTIYDVDYLSLFCYQYDVDFGHIRFKFNEKEQPLPAHIPPVRQQSVADDELDAGDDDGGDGGC